MERSRSRLRYCFSEREVNAIPSSCVISVRSVDEHTTRCPLSHNRPAQRTQPTQPDRACEGGCRRLVRHGRRHPAGKAMVPMRVVSTVETLDSFHEIATLVKGNPLFLAAGAAFAT